MNAIIALTAIIIVLVTFIVYIAARGGKQLGWWGSLRGKVDNATDDATRAVAKKELDDARKMEIAYIVVVGIFVVMLSIVMGYFLVPKSMHGSEGGGTAGGFGNWD